MSNEETIDTGATATTPGRARELLPEGNYLLQIDWIERTLSPNNKKPRLSVRFKVAAGALKGRMVFDDCYLTKDAAWRITSLAANCGIPKGTKINTGDQAALLDLFQGKTLQGRVYKTEWQGKEGRKVNWPDPNNPNRGGKKNASVAAPAEASEGSGDPIDGEIPF